MKLASLATAIGVAAGCLSAWGQERAELSTPQYSLSEKRLAQRFTTKAGYMNYVYDEPGVMKLSGQMINVDLTYRYPFRAKRPMWLAVNAEIAYSVDMTYDGGIQELDTGKVTPLSSSSHDRFYDVRMLYGINMVNLPSSTIDVYGGLGRWALNNKANNPYAYERDAIYLYVPVGLEYARIINPKFTALAGVEYDYFLGGQTTSHMGDLGMESGDLVHTQSTGSGAKLKAGLESTLIRRTVSVELFYRIWNIDASDVVTMKRGNGKTSQMIEPLNSTTMIGLNLGTRF